MADDRKNSNPEENRWGLVEAKTRDWTDEEVAVAVEYLKREILEEWAELEQLELTTGDLRHTRASAALYVALDELYPGTEGMAISDLRFKVRLVRRAELGLS